MGDPYFRSIFKDDFLTFIALKRALGFKYESEPSMLRRIDTYFVNNHLTVREISRELCEGWCRKRSYESPANHSSRISMMRAEV